MIGKGTRCARTTASAASRCSSRRRRPRGEPVMTTPDLARETDEGAQEIRSRAATPAAELAREVGAVLRTADVDVEAVGDRRLTINMGPYHPGHPGGLRPMHEHH